MMSHRKSMNIVVLLLIALTLVTCKSETNENGSDVSKTESEETIYKDPFDYCKAMGTIDSPDARYVGPAVPEVIARGLQKAFEAPPDAPIDAFMRGTFWRCMDGKVYACNVGANIPCSEKADISRKPNQGMIKWCESNPDSDFIPAVATGRATVYEWRCTGGEPTIVKEITKPDAAGYISSFWYEISPN